MDKRKAFLRGIKKGIPIALAYLAVSFAFGVTAIKGLSPFWATVLSFTNLTSSGQHAGVQMIIEHASYFEIAVTVLLINLRYALMSASLSQRIDPKVPTWKRLLFGFGITDEVFAVAITETVEVTPAYMFGIILLPLIGWTAGTAIGALGASIIPDKLLNALGICMYAMFISLIIPDAKKNRKLFFVIAVSIAVSSILYYVPVINQIGIGFKVIIATVLASTAASILFPVKNNYSEKGSDS